MSKSLTQILGFMPLTESLKATSSGVPNPFPDEFFQVSAKNKVMGDRAKYIRTTGERRTAKLAKYGSPAVRRSLRDIGSQDVRMMHLNENFQIDPLALQQLQSFEQYQQDQGMDWLSYQLDEAAHRIKNTEIASVASLLLNGALYWDASGNLLPNSSGANETYDFNVPAAHKNQLNGIIATSWALHNTDIPGHIRALFQQAAQDTGLVPVTALYGKNVPRYIYENDFCTPFLSRNSDANDKFKTTGEIPDGLFNIKRWIPVYTSFYENDSGVNTLLWDDDTIVFMPELNQPDKMNWYSMYHGSYSVPKSLEVQREGMAALSNFELVYGPFAYATIGYDPPGITVYHGSTFLPGLRNEKATWIAKVAF